MKHSLFKQLLKQKVLEVFDEYYPAKRHSSHYKNIKKIFTAFFDLKLNSYKEIAKKLRLQPILVGVVMTRIYKRFNINKKTGKQKVLLAKVLSKITDDDLYQWTKKRKSSKK